MSKHKIRISMILIVLLVFFATVQVLILNRYSTIGDRLSTLSETIDKIEEENNRLGQKIASASSMTTISAKAKEIGLSETSVPISLNSPMRIAQKLELSL